MKINIDNTKNVFESGKLVFSKGESLQRGFPRWERIIRFSPSGTERLSLSPPPLRTALMKPQVIHRVTS